MRRRWRGNESEGGERERERLRHFTYQYTFKHIYIYIYYIIIDYLFESYYFSVRKNNLIMFCTINIHAYTLHL